MPLSRSWLPNVPDALDALGEAFRTGLSGSSVVVRDGPFVSMESAGEVVSAGWAGFRPGYEYPSHSMSEELGGAAVSSTAVLSGLGPSQEETYTIQCASMVRSGATPKTSTVSQARRLAYENASAAVALVTPSFRPPYLNGAAMTVNPGESSNLHQVSDRRGTLIVLVFTIRCKAFSQQ